MRPTRRGSSRPRGRRQSLPRLRHPLKVGSRRRPTTRTRAWSTWPAAPVAASWATGGTRSCMAAGSRGSRCNTRSRS